MKNLLPLVTVAMGVALTALAYGNNAGHMSAGDRMMSYGGGILMWLIFLVVIAIAVYAIMHLVRGGGPDRSSNETALDILKKRYARGEISKQEFEEKRRHLQG